MDKSVFESMIRSTVEFFVLKDHENPSLYFQTFLCDQFGSVYPIKLAGNSVLQNVLQPFEISY